MSPSEKTAAFTSELAEQLKTDLEAAATQARLAAEQLERASDPPDAPTLAYVSVAIDRAYTALESAFVRIARDVDRAPPTGQSWHASLLHQMTLAIQDRRPAVLSATTAQALDPLRRHRHWLRHAYAASFSWPMMADTVDGFPGTVSSARTDLAKFIEFLESTRSE